MTTTRARLISCILAATTVTAASAQTSQTYTQRLGGGTALPYQPPPAPPTERTLTAPPGSAEAPASTYAPVLGSPQPDNSAAASTIAALRNAIDRRNIPQTTQGSILQQLQAPPASPTDYTGHYGASRNPAPTNQPTITGIAPPLDNETLDRTLAESTGPSLPDATLSKHYQEGLIEADIARRTQLLTAQNALDSEVVTSLNNIQAIRIALAKTKLPIIVSAEGQGNGSGPSQNPEAPGIPASYATPAPTQTQGLIMPADSSAPQGSEPRTEAPSRQPPTPMPVVYGITGPVNGLTAHVLVPYNGMHDVRVGSRLPGGMVVSSISPAPASLVMVRTKDGERALTNGTSVASTPPAAPAAKLAVIQ